MAHGFLSCSEQVSTYEIFSTPSIFPREKSCKFHRATCDNHDLLSRREKNVKNTCSNTFNFTTKPAFHKNKIAIGCAQSCNNNMEGEKKERRRRETRNSVNTRMYEASYDMNAPRQSEIAAWFAVRGTRGSPTNTMYYHFIKLQNQQPSGTCELETVPAADDATPCTIFTAVQIKSRCVTIFP